MELRSPNETVTKLMCLANNEDEAGSSGPSYRKGAFESQGRHGNGSQNTVSTPCY